MLLFVWSSYFCCVVEAEEIIDAQQAEIKLLQKLLADGRAPQRKCSKTNDAKEGEPAHNAVEEKDQTDSNELVANWSTATVTRQAVPLI